MASRSAVISVGVTSSAVIRAAAGTYYGLTLRESAGAPAAAVIRVYDNATTNSGTILETVYLAASQSVSLQYSVEDCSGGIRAVNGVYFQLVSGTVEGSIRVS